MTNARLRYTLKSVPPLRIASWNLENYGDKRDLHAAKTERLADAIVNQLGSPHILAVQEMCDDSGKVDDGVTTAMQNGQDLADAVRAKGGPEYRYVEVPPINNMDGGKPGSNIRCGYFYRPDRVALTPPADAANDALYSVTASGVRLNRNPCLIAANEAAFDESRKPLFAQFTDLKTSEQYFTANLHLASDGGFKRFREANPGLDVERHYNTPQTPLSMEQQQAQAPQLGLGAAREKQPTTFQPNAERLAQRIAQATLIAEATSQLRDEIAAHGDSEKQHIVVLGDFNTATEVCRDGVHETNPKPEVLSVLERSGLMNLGGKLGGEQPSHRQNGVSMTLDYIFASPQLAARLGNVTRPVVNVGDQLTRVSDHNPTIVTINAPHRLAVRAVPHGFGPR